MAARRKSREESTRPPKSVMIVYSIAAVLALCGIADSLYLTVLHITGQSALCGGAAACSEVLASKYAHLGAVPVAGIGLLGYFAVFSCAVFAACGYARSRFFFAIAVSVMFLGSLWFLSVQAFILHQYCRFCLLSAAITLLLTALAVSMPLPKTNEH